MAGGGRTVKVSGLPGNIAENRLVDKIKIHFLRRRNGGGEISAVSVSKSTPGTAFVTFEESEVALKLARRGKQIFQINDNSYEIMISLHCNEVDPDEVLLLTSVNVDHSKLPEGRQTVLQLHKGFPGVLLTFDPHRDQCCLEGCYTEVQALSSQILESLNLQDQTNTKRSTLKSKMDNDVSLEEPGLNPLDLQSEKHESEHENASWKTGEPFTEFAQLSGYMDQASYKTPSEDTWGGTDMDKSSYEDFSVIIDSDIFRYIHKYCTKEYQNILKRHRVEVLDVAGQDITTLYLSPRKGLSEHGICPVRKANQALAQLFQEKESQLRKERMPKTGISKEALDHAIDALTKRLPKLMIDQDDGNVYLVGIKNDVSDAKQFLIDKKGIDMGRGKDPDFLGTLSKPFSPKLGDLTLSERPGVLDSFKPAEYHLQDVDDLFRSGNGNFEVQNKLMTSEDIFSVGRNSDISQGAGVLSHLNKVQPGGFDDQDKSSLKFSSLPFFDLEQRQIGNLEFTSQLTERKWLPDTDVKLNEQSTGRRDDHKMKRKDSWKELKMAASFTRDVQTGLINLKPNDDLGVTKSSEDSPKVEESMLVKERKSPEIGQPQSLPFIKPSMNSNLRANTKLGTDVGKINGVNKTDMQALKGDSKKSGYVASGFAEKKTTMMPAYSTESQSFSLSHMDLCGHTGTNKFSGLPTTLGSGLRRSNSFSGRVSKDRNEQMTVDQSGGQKTKTSQLREVFTMDLSVSLQLWLYIKSLHNTEIDSLTSDLQLKETSDREKLSLCLRGLDPDKVNECHHTLKKLIAAAEADFDSRTLPLSMLGVTDCKDKTLVDTCTALKHSYNKVKISVRSNFIMILGPKSMCEKVEAALMEVFHVGLNKEIHGSPSTAQRSMQQFSSSGDSSILSDHHNTPDAIKKDMPNNVSKESSPSIMDRTRELALTAKQSDTQEQTSQGKKIIVQLFDKEDVDLKLGDRPASTWSFNPKLITSATQHISGNQGEGDQRSILTSQINSQHNNNFTQLTNPDSFANQARNVPGTSGSLEVKSAGLPLLKSGHLDIPLCCSCKVQSKTVGLMACGMNLCPKCQSESHIACKLCQAEANKGIRGIRGTMLVRESPITIPGFIRDTTLKIIYKIPDGIQGEGHPCPGAPFKGNTFEAFLPRNETTKRLVPLLEKAFDQGLTFIVKPALSGDARVTWGSIPHKTEINGGVSKNGFPDSTYIKRLTEALKAGVKE